MTELLVGLGLGWVGGACFAWARLERRRRALDELYTLATERMRRVLLTEARAEEEAE